MKRLHRVNTRQAELEIVECDCGYHMGIDATYLLSVESIRTTCPACGAVIDTAIICPKAGNVEVVTTVSPEYLNRELSDLVAEVAIEAKDYLRDNQKDSELYQWVCNYIKKNVEVRLWLRRDKQL